MNLIIVSHPTPGSFNHEIAKTIQSSLKNSIHSTYVLDLYQDNFTIPATEDKIREYQALIKSATRIYFVSPVWWFRCTPLLEHFFDTVFTPGFAYKFIPITKIYGYPKPLLKDKRVRTYLTHGAPAIPVLTLYVNSVKLRLVMGVYSFVFVWFRTKTRQFWSVPFVSDKTRKKYLNRVQKDIDSDLKR